MTGVSGGQSNISPEQWERVCDLLRAAGIDHAWRHVDGDPSAVIIVMEKDTYDRVFPGEAGPMRHPQSVVSTLEGDIAAVIPLKVWVTYIRPSPLSLAPLF